MLMLCFTNPLSIYYKPTKTQIHILLFRFYIRDLICKINILAVGCSMFNECCNLVAYADDLVLLAPLWCSLQFLTSCAGDRHNMPLAPAN